MPTRRILLLATAAVASGTCSIAARAGDLNAFNPGDLVISTVSGSTLNAASPITLRQFSLSGDGTSVRDAGTLTLPQVASGANAAFSGEYGSSSEGLLTRSPDGRSLTMMGYGVNAATFNSSSAGYGTAALAQTTSLTASQQSGTAYTTVPRVVALVRSNAQVDTSTALTGVFNANNPRSAATVNGSAFYVSGQGASKGDPTEGVFYATKGATTATPIDTSTDTRAVSIVNNGTGNTLYVSRDYNPPGKGGQNHTNVDTLTAPGGGLPTSAAGVTDTHVVPPATPDSSGGNNGSIDLTSSLANGVNDPRVGKFVYLSPEQYFFASPDVLYVADSGQPKNGSSGKAGLGEGGLQKWVLQSGTWTLAYDLYSGLGLVDNATANSATPTAAGVTGLFGLTGRMLGGQVQLFATSYGLNELSPSFLYEITDPLSAVDPSQVIGEQFTTLYSAPGSVAIRGVAFAPVPEPASATVLFAGLAALGLVRARRRRGA